MANRSKISGHHPQVTNSTRGRGGRNIKKNEKEWFLYFLVVFSAAGETAAPLPQSRAAFLKILISVFDRKSPLLSLIFPPLYSYYSPYLVFDASKLLAAHKPGTVTVLFLSFFLSLSLSHTHTHTHTHVCVCVFLTITFEYRFNLWNLWNLWNLLKSLLPSTLRNTRRKIWIFLHPDWLVIDFAFRFLHHSHLPPHCWIRGEYHVVTSMINDHPSINRWSSFEIDQRD